MATRITEPLNTAEGLQYTWLFQFKRGWLRGVLYGSADEDGTGQGYVKRLVSM